MKEIIKSIAMTKEQILDDENEQKIAKLTILSIK